MKKHILIICPDAAACVDERFKLLDTLPAFSYTLPSWRLIETDTVDIEIIPRFLVDTLEHGKRYDEVRISVGVALTADEMEMLTRRGPILQHQPGYFPKNP